MDFTSDDIIFIKEENVSPNDRFFIGSSSTLSDSDQLLHTRIKEEPPDDVPQTDNSESTCEIETEQTNCFKCCCDHSQSFTPLKMVITVSF